MGVCLEVSAVRPGGAASSADLGGTSEDTNENFKVEVEKGSM